MKLYVAGGLRYRGYANWLVNSSLGCELTESIEQANLVLLAGGEDISPEIYKEEEHRTTSPNVKRDIMELAITEYAIEHKIPIIGICRGAQLLCALAGGVLVQDMNHSFHHDMYIYKINGKFFSNIPIEVNSMHHQLQYPYCLKYPSEYMVLGYSKSIRDYNKIGLVKNTKVDLRTLEYWGEPEVVYYPKIKGLAIQFHPEGMEGDSEAVMYCKYLVDEILIKCTSLISQ